MATYQIFARWCRFSIFAVFPAILVGCGSFISGAGPFSGSVTSSASDPTFPYVLTEILPSNIGQFTIRLSERKTIAPVPVAQSDIQIALGDVVNVTVSDSVPEGLLFAPLAQGGTTFSNLRVDRDGSIYLPYISRTSVAGLTLDAAAQKIRSKLRGIASEPQVQVALASDISSSVLVAGAVKQPGRYSQMQGALTLLDAINLAGGPILEPHLITVTVRGRSSVTSYSYQELLTGGNLPIEPRAEVIVERARKRFVAMGAVATPGLHDLPSQAPNLLEVLGSVGGLNERSANPTGVFVFRYGDEDGKRDQPRVFNLNMRNPAAIFLARKFAMHPDDTVYVTNAPIYEWQKIISPIVQTLVLGRTVDQF